MKIRASAARLAVAANFGARDGDLNAGVVRDLAFELLEEIAFHFPHLPTAQAGDMNVVARAVAFVVVAVAVNVQQIELVKQAVS